MLVRDHLQDVVELTELTRTDVCKFRKSKSNDFHGGAGITLLEILEKANEASASWQAFILEKHIKADACPGSGPFTFQAQKEAHITNLFKAVFPIYSVFKAAVGLNDIVTAR